MAKKETEDAAREWAINTIRQLKNITYTRDEIRELLEVDSPESYRDTLDQHVAVSSASYEHEHKTALPNMEVLTRLDQRRIVPLISEVEVDNFCVDSQAELLSIWKSGSSTVELTSFDFWETIVSTRWTQCRSFSI
ncbi:hypothetical protein GEMRC1_002807 [Eukaryota sp. GEM-RC1]